VRLPTTSTGSAPELTQADLTRALELFWHPVCSEAELDASATGVIPARLLGRDLAIARLDDARVAALADRCPHRSTRLSVGCVADGALRCAYHGWRWGADGRCLEIPSMPGTAIPSRAQTPSFEATRRHGLIWVRIDDRAATSIPPLPGADDPAMRVVAGVPYTWPTSAPRRVENFVDLSHFAWVHDGSLGRHDEPVPPIPSIERVAGELRFAYDPPALDDVAASALYGASAYRIILPATVDIHFAIAGRPGVRRRLWMTACPLDTGSCRSFWYVSRNDGHDEPDDDHLAFQDLVLAEDEPVVCNQVPPELPLEPGVEISVRTDRVSIEYRRWLIEVVRARRDGGAGAVADTLGLFRA
jgi:phenylpropionate dioxygenase-like ring-hydroxylating dioxygenase large terminal subunit